MVVLASPSFKSEVFAQLFIFALLTSVTCSRQSPIPKEEGLENEMLISTTLKSDWKPRICGLAVAEVRRFTRDPKGKRGTGGEATKQRLETGPEEVGRLCSM